MDETYDAIVLGTGLKECILSGLLSCDGLKVRGRGSERDGGRLERRGASGRGRSALLSLSSCAVCARQGGAAHTHAGVLHVLEHTPGRRRE